MRILIAYSTRYPVVRGGVDTMITSLVDQLRHRHHVSLFAAGHPEEEHLTSSTVDGITTHVMQLRLPYYSKFRLRNFIAWLFEFPRSIIRLRRLVETERIDVVHLHMLNRYNLTFLALRLLGGPPYILTLHGSDVFRYRDQPPMTRHIARALLRNASRVNAVSRSLAKRAEATFPFVPRIYAIPNGVDLSRLDLLPTEDVGMHLMRQLPNRYFTIIGSLIDYKAQDVAIAAWKTLEDEFPDLHLFIVGDGELKQSYQDMINASGSSHRVHLTGYLPRNVSLSLARNGLGLIIPSRAEGIGYVLLEAGAIGLAVICSDISPFREILGGKNCALSFPVDDSDALADAVRMLVSSPDIRSEISRSLQHRINQEYTARQMANRYEEIYRRALKEKPRHRRCSVDSEKRK